MKSVWVIAVSLLAGSAAAQTSPNYVGSEACAPCHADQSAAWEGSHHAWAWTEPNAENILADFNGTAFEGGGLSAQFSAEDGYRISVTEPDGRITDYPVHSVVGVAPLQQYLLETEPGRLQSFDVVWDTEKGGWFHLYPDQTLAPDDALHWTGPYKNWNARCAECHATGYEKAYDPREDIYRSTQAEIGVGCEACHGPGSAHLDWAAGQAINDPALSSTGFTLEFSLGAAAQIDGCGGCHSRREPFGDASPLPGTPYHDSYRLSTLRPGLYHSDGQILDEVYVLGSFLQSKMHQAGVACTDCHDPHTAQRKAEGNAVCTSCHAPEGDTRFPVAWGIYDDPSHHFHPAGSAGAACKSCHMIERIYMGNDGRRDHSFRIPRPDLAAETGAPDACTDCHQDQTASWAADEIAERFGAAERDPPHYGRLLSAGRARPEVEAAALAALAIYDTAPGIVRASALDLLAPVATPALADSLASLLSDADPLVRAAAIPMQRAADPGDFLARLLPLTDDPLATVRIAAARNLLDVPQGQLSEADRAKLSRAMDDWRESIAAKLDFPETHMVLGGAALTMRNFPAAQAAFGEAARRDPQRVEAWVMAIRLALAQGQTQQARAIWEAASRANPSDLTLQSFEAALPPPPDQ